MLSNLSVAKVDEDASQWRPDAANCSEPPSILPY